jgi:hypothetical protein
MENTQQALIKLKNWICINMGGHTWIQILKGKPQENREVGDLDLHRNDEDPQQCCGVAMILYIGSNTMSCLPDPTFHFNVDLDLPYIDLKENEFLRICKKYKVFFNSWR